MPVTKSQHVANPTAVAAAGLAAAAGLLHIAVTRTHLAESTIDGVLMLLAAWFQLGFAAAMLVAPTRALRLAGAGLLFLIVAGWVVARTAGLPFGHSEGAPEEVRLLGTVATVLGGLAGLAALAGVRPATDPAAPAGPSSLLGLAAAGTALAALVSVAIVVTPTGHSSGAHDSEPHGHSSPGGRSSGGHDDEQPPTGRSGGAGSGTGTTGSGTTGSGTTPTAATPSSGDDDGDGHEHAPGKAH